MRHLLYIYLQRALDSGDLRTECEVGNLELGTWAWESGSGIWDRSLLYDLGKSKIQIQITV